MRLYLLGAALVLLAGHVYGKAVANYNVIVNIGPREHHPMGPWSPAFPHHPMGPPRPAEDHAADAWESSDEQAFDSSEASADSEEETFDVSNGSDETQEDEDFLGTRSFTAFRASRRPKNGITDYGTQTCAAAEVKKLEKSCKKWGDMPGMPMLYSKFREPTFLLQYPEDTEDLYAVCYRRTLRKPAYAAHKMTRKSVDGASGRGAHSFPADDRVCKGEQDSESWYTAKGYTRAKGPNGSYFHKGHVVPNAAFGTMRGKESTFKRTNIFFQVWDRNSYMWASLEGQNRDFVLDKEWAFDALYVYTAQAYTIDGSEIQKFIPSNLKAQNKEIAVPPLSYKVIVCEDSSADTAVMQMCWSDNPLPTNRRKVSSKTKTITSAFGSHKTRCPASQAEKRCIPYGESKAPISDECFDNKMGWTLSDVLRKSELNWGAVKKAVKRRFKKLVLNKTCAQYMQEQKDKKRR